MSNKTTDIKFVKRLNSSAVTGRASDFINAVKCTEEVRRKYNILESENETDFIMNCIKLIWFGNEKYLQHSEANVYEPIQDEDLTKTLKAIGKMKVLLKAVGIDFRPLNINSFSPLHRGSNALNHMLFPESGFPGEDQAGNEDSLIIMNADGSFSDNGLLAYLLLNNGNMLVDTMSYIKKLSEREGKLRCPDDLILAVTHDDNNVDYDILTLISRYFPCTFPDGSTNQQIRPAMIMMGIDPDYDSRIKTSC